MDRHFDARTLSENLPDILAQAASAGTRSVLSHGHGRPVKNRTVTCTGVVAFPTAGWRETVRAGTEAEAAAGRHEQRDAGIAAG